MTKRGAAKRSAPSAGLSHVQAGRVRMVDVSAKPATLRRAVATAEVIVGRDVLRALAGPGVPKGDVLTTAQIAGVLAAKRTADLIPLCHGLSPECVDVTLALRRPDCVLIRGEARITGRTGVEMEALVAVSVAALTVYDMCKSMSKEIVIGPIRLEEKSGGKSGEWKRGESRRARSRRT